MRIVPPGEQYAAPSICASVVCAIAQIAAGFIHELNNKLGPVLLNAELLSKPGEHVPGVAADIVRNVLDMQEMLRDIEAILPRNLERDVPLEPMLQRVERVVRGALRRRRLQLALSKVDESCLMDTEPFSTMVAMLLVPFVFHGPPRGEHGTLSIRHASAEGSWTWRIEVDPVCAPDPVVTRSLLRISARNGWKLSSGCGWMVVESALEDT